MRALLSPLSRIPIRGMVDRSAAVKLSLRSLSSAATTTEIERKFIYNDTILRFCKLNAISSREVVMEDVYFDNSDFALTTRDMWLRQRNDTFELKWPMLLDSTRKSTNQQTTESLVGLDFYQESTDVSKIAEVLQKSAAVNVKFRPSGSVSESRVDLSNADIHSFGSILTHRTRYNLSMQLPAHLRRSEGEAGKTIKLFVDIDAVRYTVPEQLRSTTPSSASQQMAFYQIGEVEFNFSEDANSGAGKSGDPADNSTMEDKASNEAIMSHVFSVIGIQPAPVRGKVLEYLSRFRPQHYEALRGSGQLASKGL